MKQTENNEIDLLLRGLARREGARSVPPEDRSAMHLDADELNSFAAQALPAAARALHLALVRVWELPQDCFRINGSIWCQRK